MRATINSQRKSDVRPQRSIIEQPCKYFFTQIPHVCGMVVPAVSLIFLSSLNFFTLSHRAVSSSPKFRDVYDTDPRAFSRAAVTRDKQHGSHLILYWDS